MRTLTPHLSVGFAASLSLLATSCADPVPPPAQGAVYYYIHDVSGCHAQAHPQSIPVSPTSEPTVTATGSNGLRVVNGVQGATVSCRVAPAAGGKFDVSASLQVANGQFTVAGTVTPGTSNSPGQVSINDTITVTTVSGDLGDCTIDTDPKSGATKFHVEAGSIWASVTCSKFAPPGASGVACTLGPSYFTFQNCASE